jgi:hypothetical protein
MSTTPRWERCISNRGGAAEQFVRDYFRENDRRVGLIAGAGFDPRSSRMAELLSGVAKDRARALFLREERPGPNTNLVNSAVENVRRLSGLIPANVVESFDVFDKTDTAPVGGRRVIGVLRTKLNTEGLTDLVIDCSALSAGVCFSITKYCMEIAERDFLNLHLTVIDHPDTDSAIEATHCGRPSSPHGFQGEWQLAKYEKAARLWLPQLGQGKRSVLEEVHKFVNPHEVCPILPFPATWPRAPDILIEGYGDLFEGPWKVDARDLIYAHEKSPLDLYRAILRIDNARERVFRGTGGSQVILSPVGSKAVALGMLMAALERNFAVVLVESLAYKATPTVLEVGPSPTGELVHIWLHGEAYASATREVSREG